MFTHSPVDEENNLEEDERLDLKTAKQNAEQIIALLAPRSNLEQEVQVDITSGWIRAVTHHGQKSDFLSAREMMLLLKDSGVPKAISDLFKSQDDKPYGL